MIIVQLAPSTDERVYKNLHLKVLSVQDITQSFFCILYVLESSYIYEKMI